MTNNFFDEKEILYLKSLNYFDKHIYSKSEEDKKQIETKNDFINNFFHNFFTKYIINIEEKCNNYYVKYQLEEGSQITHKSKLINEYLENIPITNELVKYSYNLIMSLFNMDKWVGIGFEYNIIAYKFKIRNVNNEGITTVREARSLCVELCEILNKKHLENIYDEEMNRKFDIYSTKIAVEKLGKERKLVLFNHSDSNCIEELKHDYAIVNNDMSKFIGGGSVENYRSVIEYHKLPEGVPNLRMKSDILADIIRFADCFEIPLSKISKIFDEKVEAKNRDKKSVNDFLRVLRKYNDFFYKENSMSK